MAQTRAFDVPRQKAATAIPTFAKQAGVQVLARSEAVQNVRTRAVHGSHTVEQALEILLRDTGLAARQPADSGGIILIEPVEPAGPRKTADDGAGADIVVTGSNIAGAEITSPVTVVTARDIERSGYTTPDQLVRSLTQVGSSSTAAGFGQTGAGLNIAQALDGSVTGGNGSNAYSAGSGINLRGLGEGSTLILLNGRRLPSAGSSGGQTTDISTIPLNAIERIEILPNSASAVYGADAVGGVVNIILKKNYRGIELSGRYGLSSTLADDKSLTGSAGFGWGSGSFLVSGNYRRDEPVLVSKLGATIGDQTARGGADYRSDRCLLGLPGLLPVLIAPAVAATATTPALARACFYGPAGAGTNLTATDLVLSTQAATTRLTDYRSIDLTPQVDTLGFTGTLTQKLIGSWDANLTGLWSRRESLLHSPLAAVSIVAPADNPFNPLGRRVRTYYDFRGEVAAGQFPDSVQQSTYTSWSAILGLRGALPIPTWRATIDASYGRNVTTGYYTGVNSTAANAAAARTDRATALNIFGDGSAQTAAALQGLFQRVDYPRWVSSEQQVTAKATGDLFTLPMGIVKAVVGTEYRQPTITRTIALDNGTLVADGQYSRTQYAVFGEAQVPLAPKGMVGPGLEALTLTLAGRQEWFDRVRSVPAANAFTGRVGLAWDVLNALSLRGQYSTSFKVPYNDQLFAPQIVSADTSINDPKLGGQRVSYTLTSGGNPNLKNQTAKSYSGGFGLNLQRLTGSVDYYRIDYRNLVFSPSLTDFVTLEDYYPQYFTRAAPEAGQSVGPLTAIQSVFINAASFKTSGLDMKLNYRLPTQKLGEFDLQFAATEILTQKRQLLPGVPVTNLRGNALFGSPFSARGVIDWSKGIVATTVAVNYKSPTINPVYGAVQTRVGSLTTVDAQLRVRFNAEQRPFQGLTLSMGATNLFNAESPFLDSDYGVDFYKWDPRGRVVYLTLGKALH